ncbi:MAG: amidohydrolase family protein [Armatimonadota bacterium]
MDHICELCAQHDIPLQLHTGPAGGTGHLVEWGDPLHLNGLMMRHPWTKFVLFHAGGPFTGECRDLAVQFPNCYLDLCGVIAVKGLRSILDDWIERVPHTKLMWGTNANIVEEVFALVSNFHVVLADLLVDRVEEGYFSLRTAQDIARGILGGNARSVLRI